MSYSSFWIVHVEHTESGLVHGTEMPYSVQGENIIPFCLL